MLNPKVLQSVRLIQKIIIVNEDGLVLAMRRPTSDRSRPDSWDFPGGGYEQGEDIRKSLEREVMEESGLTLTSFQPIFIASKINDASHFYKGENTVFAVCYLSLNWSGDVVLSNEHVEYKWVSPEEFLSYEFGSDGGFFTESLSAYLQMKKQSIGD